MKNVEKWAKRISTGKGQELDDLYQLCRIGAWKAGRDFDHTKGAGLDTYTVYKIRGEFTRARRTAFIVRAPNNTKENAYGMSIETPQADSGMTWGEMNLRSDSEAEYIIDVQEKISFLKKYLTPKEFDVFYRTEGCGEGLRDVAKLYGLSHQGAAVVKARALKKAKKAVKTLGLS